MVSVPYRYIPGVLTCYAYTLPGYDVSCIVVTKPGGDYHCKTLSKDATDAEIRTAVNNACKKEVTVQPSTFPIQIFNRATTNC